MSTTSHVTQRKNMQQTNLSDLPDEVLEIIFDHLDVPDLKDASLVCRRWCNLAFTRHRISRVVFVPKLQGDKDVLQSKRKYRHAYLFNPSQNLPYVIDLMHAFRFPELRLNFLSLPGTVRQFRSILLAAPCLQRLSVNNLCDQTNMPIPSFPIMSELKQLELEGDNILKYDAFDLRTIAPSLQCLTMSCNSVEQFEVYSHFSGQLKMAQVVSRTEDVFCRFCELTFPRLEQLSLTSQFYWYENDPEIAVGFIQRHSTLRSLCIDIVSMPKALVNVITSHILQLTALSIALNPYCRMSWEKGSFETLAKLTKLKHLKCRGDIGTNIFYKCKAITSLKSVYVKLLCTHDQLDLLRDVHKVAPQLKSLGIGGTETNERAIKFICKHFSNLSSLKIRWSKVETGDGLARIAKLPHLRELGLWTYDECRDYRHIPRNHVRFLTLCCNWKDSDGELLQLPKIFPGLEKLDLYPLVVVRNSTVERIHEMIPKCRINVHKGSACLQLFNDAINVE